MNLKTLVLATAAAAALFAPAAKAQAFSFGIGKPGKFAAYVNFGHRRRRRAPGCPVTTRW
jgi:hypothetical protein